MPSLIVIPTFNRAHQIGRAIEASLRQSQHDVEVLVVDDASTDDTRGACSAFFDNPRFGYIQLGANVGTASAKNVGMALAAFDAVTFHDSDDLPHPDKLIRQERTLWRADLAADPCLPWGFTGGRQAPAAPAAIDIVLCAHAFIRADGSTARISRTLSLVDDFFPNLQFAAGPLGDWVLINSGLFRRDLLRRIGGFRDSVEEDRELRNRSLMFGANVWFLDEVLLTKYDQPDSLTAQAATGYRSAKRAEDRKAVWEAIRSWRSGGAPQPAPIAIPDAGLAFASSPQRLEVAADLPMADDTRRWLRAGLAALGR